MVHTTCKIETLFTFALLNYFRIHGREFTEAERTFVMCLGARLPHLFSWAGDGTERPEPLGHHFSLHWNPSVT